MTEHEEIRSARNRYWWLWLSPLLTLPTLLFVFIRGPGYELVCRGTYHSSCDWNTASRIDGLIAGLVSAAWHLAALLGPLRSKAPPFVRWHGLQALLLAGIRTVVALVFLLAFPEDFMTLAAIPILIAVWLFGTLWGQRQAIRGECSLMRWAGREHELAPYRVAYQRPLPPMGWSPTDAVHAIRFSKDPVVRRQALAQLDELGMVETL